MDKHGHAHDIATPDPAPKTTEDLRTELARLRGIADRLAMTLALLRQAYADLVAAGRATLLAHADGETDPLCYLRDELPPAPPGHPLSGRYGGGR